MTSDLQTIRRLLADPANVRVQDLPAGWAHSWLWRSVDLEHVHHHSRTSADATALDETLMAMRDWLDGVA